MKSCFFDNVHTFYYGRKLIIRIILDTDKKTIIVPWNYAAKLDELNKIIKQGGGSKNTILRATSPKCGTSAWQTPIRT